MSSTLEWDRQNCLSLFHVTRVDAGQVFEKCMDSGQA
jgi:hypothetical protein